ncbi:MULTISPECIES: universal stress protein [unclassified Kribbella]|uniref:universal stress protein n=1 Tax=unclassified Kribbella TaxID=2644121 RepID=UPI0033EB537A
MQVTSTRGLVVVRVDATPESDAAIGQGFDAAHRLGAELILLHIPPSADSRHWDTLADAPWYAAARQLVTNALNGWPDKYPDVVYRTHYRQGNPAEVLAGYTKVADRVFTGDGAVDTMGTKDR